MNKLIEGLFPQGYRKLVVAIIALAVGAGFENFGVNGLTEEMTNTILGVVAAFTTGNVVEHLMSAIGGKKEEALPPPMVSGDVPEVREVSVSDVLGEVSRLNQAMSGINQQVQIQAQNLAQVVNIINSMRQGGVNKVGVPPTTAGNREL